MTPAAMPLHDGESYPVISWIVVFGVSIWAGVISMIRKVKPADYTGLELSKIVIKGFFALFVEIMVSTFVGFLTFLICRLGNFSELQTLFSVAVLSHMGTRAIFLYERATQRLFPGDGNDR